MKNHLLIPETSIHEFYFPISSLNDQDKQKPGLRIHFLFRSYPVMKRWQISFTNPAIVHLNRLKHGRRICKTRSEFLAGISFIEDPTQHAGQFLYVWRKQKGFMISRDL